LGDRKGVVDRMVGEVGLGLRKRAARRHLRRAMAGQGAELLGEKSRAACERLCTTHEFQQANVVMLFLSLANEVETTAAVSRALSHGKTVAVPMVLWQENVMVPVRLESLECEMAEDRYGLRHPVDAVEIATAQIELVVTPGLGFDDKGNRLGRGGGFYDRFLKLVNANAVTCGLALEEQLIPQVPVLAHDVAVHMLVTDKTVRRFNCCALRAAAVKGPIVPKRNDKT